MEAEYEIWTENLTKIFPGKEKFKAVKGINLKIEPGIHGFLGPNGAGKTTTINMLIGALSISEGSAKIRGHKAGSVSAKQLIGFVPQDPNLYTTMTGQDYLTYLGKLGGLSDHDSRKRAQELLVYFNIWEERNREIGKYSGGMKQKIAIAAAIIHDPKILLLDEPTANLDPIGRQNIIDIIKDLAGKITVFLSSHILAEIEQMADKVTMINHGEIVISDTLKNIKQKYIGKTYMLHTNKNQELYQIIKEDPNIESTWINEEKDDGSIQIIPKDPLTLQKRIPRLLIENDAILFSFKQPEISLQDIFMSIMNKKEEN